jgi:hypothetical protein
MRRVTLLFWTAITFGFLVSPGVFIGRAMARGKPFDAALRQLARGLFQSGANEFLLAVIAALPFVAAAVIFLIHLSTEPSRKGRWAGAIARLPPASRPLQLRSPRIVGSLSQRLSRHRPAHDTLLKP